MEKHQNVATSVTNGYTCSNNVITEYNNWDLTNGHAHDDTICTNFEDWDLSKSDCVKFNDSNLSKSNHDTNDSVISKFNGQSFNNSEDADETITNVNVYSCIENTTSDNWDLNVSDYPNSTLNYHESNGLIDPGCENSESARSIDDSWGNEISVNDQVYGDFGNGNSKQVLQDSWGNANESNNYQYNKNEYYQNGHSNGGYREKVQRNFIGKNLNDYTKSDMNKLENEKPSMPKSTYIPPDFEDNDNLAIEVGSNFIKYDKIEVTVSGMEVPKNIASFRESGLRDVLLNNLEKCHYITPTPIQKYALPIIMNGRDMIASAQTGSGKTVSVKIIYIIICNK